MASARSDLTMSHAGFGVLHHKIERGFLKPALSSRGSTLAEPRLRAFRIERPPRGHVVLRDLQVGPLAENALLLADSL